MSRAQLASAVLRERYGQRLTQADVERRGGPSVASLRTIENGRFESLRPKTLSALETALGWRPGTAGVLLEGGSLPESKSVASVLARLVAASVDLGRMRVLSGFPGVAS